MRGLIAAGILLAFATGGFVGCRKYVSPEAQHGMTAETPPAASSGPADPNDIVARMEEEKRGRERLNVTGAGAALERVTADPVDEFAPSVSPDGKQLLFQVETYTGADAPSKLKQQTIVGVDPNTRGQRTLYTSASRFASNPAWMPDGTSYVFVTNQMGPYALVRALTGAPNSSVAVIVSSDIAPQPSHPSPSPDGTRVAFATMSPDGGRSICTSGVDGSKFTVIGDGFGPAYAPDGTSLAFVRNVSGYDHIFLVDPQKGTSLVELTSGSSDNSAPTWSPDGQYIAFASNRGYEELGKKREEVLHLFIMKKDGTGLVQLTSGLSLSGAPSWSSDGWLYFSSNQSGNYDIWRIKLAGDLAELVPIHPGDKKADGKDKLPEASLPTPVGCTKDNDCKGDRVCEYGQCVIPEPKAPVAPPPPAPVPSTTPKKKWQH